MDDNFEIFDSSEEEVERKEVDKKPESPKETLPRVEGPSSILKKRNLEEEKPDISTTYGKSEALLKELKSRATKKKVKEVEADVVFKMIGYDEKIYKLTDMYVPTSDKIKNNMEKFIKSYNGLKEVEEFEERCALPPFDLNEAFYVFEKKMRGISDDADHNKTHNKKVEEPKADTNRESTSVLNEKIQIELDNRPQNTCYPLNYVESPEFFQKIHDDVVARNDKDQHIQTEFLHYTELWKKFDLVRKEHIEQEQTKKIKESSKKKSFAKETNDWNFDMMLRNTSFNNVQNTPNFMPFESKNSEEADMFPFNTNQMPFNYQMNQSRQSFNVPPKPKTSMKARFDAYFDDLEKQQPQRDKFNSLLVFERQHISDFKKLLNKRRNAENCKIRYCEGFNTDLRSTNIFKYSMINKKEDEFAEVARLNLDIYHHKADGVSLNKPDMSNYYNTNLHSDYFKESFKFLYKDAQKPDEVENKAATKINYADLIKLYKEVPYLDANDHYVRSLIENYNEKNLLGEDKPEITLIIDDKGKKDKDPIKEQISMQVKKIMRMKLGRENMLGDLTEEARAEILKNTDSEIRKLLMLDKTNDLNEHDELIKNKKRKIKQIHHSKVATNFLCHDFIIIPEKSLNLYRPDISGKVIFDLLFDKHHTWKFKIVKAKNEKHLKSKNSNGIFDKLNADNNYGGFINIGISRNRNNNANRIIQSHEVFNSPSKLSLKSDDYILLEYIEKEPLILSDFGMGSRMERWIYLTRLATNILEKKFGYSPIKDQDKSGNIFEDKKKLRDTFVNTVTSTFGDKGEENYMVENEKLPTIGQLTKKDFCGLTLLDNNLSRTPVFNQRVHKNDFLLVCSNVNGKKRYYLRRIKSVYTAGQIQPKQEIFSPYSRQYNNFLRKLQKFYIKSCFEKDNTINIEEIKRVFPTINDHNLRKQIKLMGGEEDPYDKKLFYQIRQCTYEQTDIADDGSLDVTPEEMCLYERMMQSHYKLYFMGIEELKSTDKLSVLRTKYFRNNIDDLYKTLVAKRIIEEILLSAWNVSYSFLSCQQGQGRMYLEGFGDPTNGHGGINFIKLPLKISRYESMLIKLSQKTKPYQIVSGTRSDLRSLSMKFVHSKLKKFGYSDEVLSNLERWDKIELLREIANRESETKSPKDIDEELVRFARNLRMTTEKQKEKYQTDINNLFMKMVFILSRKSSSNIMIKKEIQVEEGLNDLLKQQKEELEKYKALEVSDEEQLANIKPREIKKKSIVLKPMIKKYQQQSQQAEKKKAK